MAPIGSTLMARCPSDTPIIFAVLMDAVPRAWAAPRGGPPHGSRFTLLIRKWIP